MKLLHEEMGSGENEETPTLPKDLPLSVLGITFQRMYIREISRKKLS
jgi:hypothetical protein